MRRNIALLALLCLSLIISFANANPVAELKILTEFFESTDGFEWKVSRGWLMNTNYCTWYGIVCYNGRVQSLRLPKNNLKGKIPESIGGLVYLYDLNLSDNNLTGAIPEGLTLLSNLNTLNLSNNKLDRMAQSIGRLKTVREINLSKNNLGGAIPQSIATLPMLYSLDLSDNRFSGAVGTEVSTLYTRYALKKLNLKNNAFSVVADLPIPSPFLSECNMTGNKIRCPIPRWAAVKCGLTCGAK